MPRPPALLMVLALLACPLVAAEGTEACMTSETCGTEDVVCDEVVDPDRCGYARQVIDETVPP